MACNRSRKFRASLAGKPACCKCASVTCSMLTPVSSISIAASAGQSINPSIHQSIECLFVGFELPCRNLLTYRMELVSDGMELVSAERDACWPPGRPGMESPRLGRFF